MTMTHPRRLRVLASFETARHPALFLYIAIVLLYAPSLLGGFVLDDHRCMRCLREYHEGKRESLGLYNFLPGGEENVAARQAGWYPWWVREDVRYRHLRVVSERVLYLEYLAFGESPIGYRIVGLLLYLVGVRLVLAFFRSIAGDERLARWAALLFAVATCHTIPVIFISAQCDVIALVLVSGILVLLGRYILDQRGWSLAAGALLFAGALNSKEVALAAAVSPLCYWLAWRNVAGVRRRAIISCGVLVVVGCVWLVCYAAGGYGSNSAIMLDPIHAPVEYLMILPGRSLILLSAWPIPINPFLFYLGSNLQWAAAFYMAVGAVVLLLVTRLLWKYHREQRGLAGMIFLVLVFLPILVCTTPDDRVLTLPSIGLTFLGAVWMVGRRRGEPTKEGGLILRRLPAILFIVAQVGTVLATSGLMLFMEAEAQGHLRVMVNAFGRPPRPGDRIVLVNLSRSYEALFTQDRLRALPGCEDVSVNVLCDVIEPKVSVVDSHTLRLEAGDQPFLESFTGRISSPANTAWRVGEKYDAGEIVGEVVETRNGGLHAVEIRFHEPLASDKYRFFWSHSDGPPVRFDPFSVRMPTSQKDEAGA